MKKFLVTLFAVALVINLGSMHGYALDLGANITTSDLDFDLNDPNLAESWHSNREDQETEPGTVTNQSWDLEAFFLKGMELSMVGGFNFGTTTGQLGGDIFIDIDGDMKYGDPLRDGSITSWPDDNKNIFGYDYVIDLNFTAYTYNIYEIDETAFLKPVGESINLSSNAWAYDNGAIGTVASDVGFSYEDYNDLQIENGLTGGTHNVVTGIDLGFLTSLTDEFYVKYTMECGNDDLIGHAIIPEPSTVFLIGLGLLGLVGLGRKRMKK